MAIGVWGGVAGLGGAIAPTLGAVLVEAWGWRAVFFINLPFVAAALIAGWRVLPRGGERKQERFDPVAVPLAAIAVGAIVLVIVEVSDWGLLDTRILVCLAVAAVLLPWFVIRSSRHPAPLLDLDLFRLRSFTVGNIAQALFVGSSFGWLVLMPSFFHDVWGWSPLAAGFGLAPAATVGAILSPFAGRAADRIGHRELVAVGCICGAAGTLWWAVAVGDEPHYSTAILPGMLLAGLGITGGFATLTGALDEPRATALLLDGRRRPQHDLPAGQRDRHRHRRGAAERRRRRPRRAVPQGVAGRDGVRAGRGDRDDRRLPPPRPGRRARAYLR